MASTNENKQDLWFLKSNFPVFLPSKQALNAPDNEFDAFIQKDIKRQNNGNSTEAHQSDDNTATATESEAVLVSDASTTAALREDLVEIAIEDGEGSSMADVGEASPDTQAQAPTPGQAHPFMDGLLSQQEKIDKDTTGPSRDMKNLMLTENSDLAHRSTNDVLVDLFSELEDVVSGPRLLELLNGAWRRDPASTLKIIFNARSIHLGKASRQTFYRCAGWLAKYHPLTLIANLPWLSRPVIQKKAEKKDSEKKADEDEMVFVEQEMDEDDPARFDIKNGVAHGYWKDLLNILALHVNGKLDVLADPRDILNVEREKSKKNWPKDQETAKTLRHKARDNRHEAAIKAFEEDAVYRALHMTIARLFAVQLQSDLERLRGVDPKAKKNVSLCAKWAPSSTGFHDKHTWILTSIAEIMFPISNFAGFAQYDEGNKEQREFYLRHARESYRKDVSALRKHLECVERDITAKTFENIKYERVPSIAMNNYAPLFAQKDTGRFEAYIDKVASGKAQISGATLLPSTLIKAVRTGPYPATYDISQVGGKRKGTKNMVDAKMKELEAKTLDGQWKSLVQRIRDSGTLENCIAVADVSGSMMGPTFPDGTVPMDTSIGLSLLVAEVTKPPFGGAFITFSEKPRVQKIDLSKGLHDKYNELVTAHWNMCTDFVAVFEKLILPMAIKNKLAQEDMVKRIFVFSDMQFNSASSTRRSEKWSTSYERIQKKYQDAGYEMPELVFWNLAGGRAGYNGAPGYFSGGDPVAPKPVTASEEGTALVSGYSQGMLKVFLDSGSFEDEDAEEEIVEKIGEDGEVVVEKKKRQKTDAISVVKRAIGHPAYNMLHVVD